mmetsp:Transcript_53232/g.150030  ORF Transcript_53232/g.150030 Transcript_53232/m.150030 type:complete len:498 (-) Transcript_53232:109-1602(-)
MGNGTSSRFDKWHAFAGRDHLQPSAMGGKVGLANLGNTCFMNTGLQCLCHIEPCAMYFLSGKYKEELNTRNPLGSGGQLAKEFAELQRQLWQKEVHVWNPKPLHKKLCAFCPHLFEDFAQQDVQEFLSYMMDGLHEDLNLAKGPPQQEPPDEEVQQLERERGEEYVAALAWMRYLQQNKSFLLDLFQGQLRSLLSCQVCGYVSKKFDPFLWLSLPVTKGMRTVADAMVAYLAQERMQGDDMWLCPKCDKRVPAVKKIDIMKLPPVLMLHFKRFEIDMDATMRQGFPVFNKINTFLRSEPTLNLNDFVTSRQRVQQLYDVVAIAHHHGQFGSGHYTATCRHPIDGLFYHFDDTRVRNLGTVEAAAAAGQVVGKDAYVLFLVRQAEQSDGVRRQTVSLPDVWPHWVSRKNSVMGPAVEEALRSGKAATAPASLPNLSGGGVSQPPRTPSPRTPSPPMQSYGVVKAPTRPVAPRLRPVRAGGAQPAFPGYHRHGPILDTE